MKKRILVVIQLVRRGGVELVAINFARNLDKTKYDVSFLLIDPYENQDEILLKELKSEGFSFFCIPENCKGYFSRFNFLKKFFKNEKFDAVHSHVLLFSGLVLCAAKINGVKVRIAHSHVIKWNRRENLTYKIYKTVMKVFLKLNANVKMACSIDAGKFLFGEKEFLKNGIYIPNAIETKKYAFDYTLRSKKRNELDISENQLVVGHIGTIYKIKNQSFLVEIFAQMLQEKENAVLLLVGEKVDTEPIIEKAKQLNVEDKVVFLGQRNDINELLSAFDIMIFPSLHEALPVSLIEAQASKLPCLISDAVTTQVKYNENVCFASLKESTKAWSDKAFELLETDRASVSLEKLIKEYDISSVVEKLNEIYLS